MDGGQGNYEVTPLIAAAHELKAPLSLVRQLALRLQDDSLTNGEKQRLLTQTVLTSERALRLTSDLTRSARLDSTLFSLEPINPEQLCGDIVSELAPLFEAYGKKVAIKTRKHPLLLVANRDLLRRILLGFSDNALHYSLPGTPVHMQIQAFKKAGMIRIGVRDFGPALSSDMWRKLQKKLITAPQPVHSRPESSGLGLYIASQFAEAMHGRIGVVRHKDGATFYVELQASSQLSLL
ncbi:MAG: HAMP domain-containing sensor histidine kinase [Candidatus Microsaccharimonas sp.]